MGMATGSGTELAFAIAHEVGNHLGAIRLQAHLVDEDLDVRELAEASILIDGLAGRSGPLLALLRPLLSADWKPAGNSTWAHILGRVQKQIEDEGTGGTRFAVQLGEPASGNPGADIDPMPDHEWLHPLLTALAEATIAHVGRGRFVTFRLAAGMSESTLWVEDNGEAEDVGPGAAARGRPLVVGIARNLVGRIGGRVNAIRTDSETRIGLVFPS